MPEHTPAGSDTPEANPGGDGDGMLDAVIADANGDTPDEGMLSAVEASTGEFVDEGEIDPALPDEPAEPDNTSASETPEETQETPADEPVAPEGEAEGEDGEADTDATEPPVDEILSEDPSPEELKEARPRTKRRIEQLLSQRNEARAAAAQVQPMLDYMQENDIPQEDVDVLLGLSAQLRSGNFQGFLAGIQPYLDFAQQQTGDILPDDLRTQVEQGYLTEQYAKELAASRATIATQRQQAERTAQRQQQETGDLQQSAIVTAANDWSRRMLARDPELKGDKMEMVRQGVVALVAKHGNPENPAEANMLLDTAYKQTSELLARLTGSSPEQVPSTARPGAVSQPASTAVTAEPKNMLEAAFAGLRQAHGGA